MKASFIETPGFSEVREAFLPDPALARLQQELMAEPEMGDVLPSCGGLRKLRLHDENRRKGKRGGARLIYLHVPEVKRFYLIDIYGKDEKEDLSAADKKAYGRFAKAIKEAAIAEVRNKLKENET